MIDHKVISFPVETSDGYVIRSKFEEDGRCYDAPITPELAVSLLTVCAKILKGFANDNNRLS